MNFYNQSNSDTAKQSDVLADENTYQDTVQQTNCLNENLSYLDVDEEISDEIVVIHDLRVAKNPPIVESDTCPSNNASQILPKIYSLNRNANNDNQQNEQSNDQIDEHTNNQNELSNNQNNQNNNQNNKSYNSNQNSSENEPDELINSSLSFSSASLSIEINIHEFHSKPGQEIQKHDQFTKQMLRNTSTVEAPRAIAFKPVAKETSIQKFGYPVNIVIEQYSDTVENSYKAQILNKQKNYPFQITLISAMQRNNYKLARSVMNSTKITNGFNIEIKFSEVDLGKMFDLLVNIDGALFAMPLTYKPLSKEGQLPTPNAQAIPAQLVQVEEQQLTPVSVTFGEQVQIVQKKQVLFTAPLESCDVYTAPSQKNLFSFFADEQVSLHSAEYLRLKTLLKVNFGDAFSLTSEEFFGPAFSKLKESTKLQTDCVALLEFNSALAVVKLESEAQLQRLVHQVCALKQLLFAKQDEARKKKVQSYQFDLSQITLQQFLQQKQQNEVKVVGGTPVFQKPTDFKVLYLQGGCVARISNALDLNCQHAVWVLTEDKSFQVKAEDKPITNISQKVHVWLDGQWKSFQMKNGQLAVKKKTYSLALNKSVSWQRYMVIGSGHSSVLVDLGEDIRKWAVFQNVI
ncbi:Hypothetical_protein [Hexamita inflata]|uniref:Hypothetical_protein n=1 Tax=Hexamita inflata TaxID=28002 RepID=A0AA86NVZ8_9EUKA|nr:Hypothetical protein HINF_LOCUS14301 [Hexamita inflata]